AEATRALTEAETTATTLTVEAAQPAPSRWPIVAAGGGIAAAAVGVAVWYSVSGKPDVPAGPDVAMVTPPPPPRIQPTQIAKVEPTAVPRVEPTAVELAEVKPAPEPPKPEPPKVEPVPPKVEPPVLALASAKPTSRSIKLKPGAEQPFEASLKSGDPESLQWRLEGDVVGKGTKLRLGKDRTTDPGRRKLELVGVRGGETTTLKSWDLDIVAPPLDFAGLEPSARSLERPPGVPISFRAPVRNPDGDKLAFAWEVNGRPARGADGPSYEFEPDEPGDYQVKVKATAPWGSSVDNTWTLKVSPKPAPEPTIQVVRVPPTPKDVPKPLGDAQSELSGWIQSYCTAFENKDTNTLIQLGHLSSQAEASRLQQVLSAMDNLKLSCTNPKISVKGDQATVSFDRKDQWTDPRGTTMERALPRITKNLRRSNGRWVAVP
ncbi:MAG: hypothetical protein ACREQ9_10130, partial [Candidatus Binatia bacterium]